MKEKFLISFLILFHVFAQISLAQQTEIKFNLVEGNNGEPLGQINAITQDANGYMWFSGQGANYLYKYDGVRMIGYKPDNLNPDLKFGYLLETVYADPDGMIWIGFVGGNMEQFNPATGVFKQYKHDSLDPGSLSSGMVSVFLRDHLGRLWVGTANGLDLLDEKTGKFIHFRNEPGNPSSLSSNTVRAIYEDRKGVLWIGTGFEFDFGTFKSAEDGGLNRMESNGKFTRFMHDPNDPGSLINNKVRAIFEDSRGQFWIGTSGDGLHTMDRTMGKFTRHLYNPKNPEQLSRPQLKSPNIPDPITFIREDASGAIWIGTYLSGINRYDTTTKKITHYESSNGYPDKSCWASYESRDGVLWLSSTDQGGFLFRVDPTTNKLRNQPAGSLISCLFEDAEGHLWVNSLTSGLMEYDREKKPVHRFATDPKNSIDLVRTNIFSIFQNNPDTLWLCTSGGVILLNKKTGHFNWLLYRSNQNFKSEKIPGKPVFQIIQDKNGMMWFATSAGLFQYNPGNQSATSYFTDKKSSGTDSDQTITAVLEVPSGDIFAGSGDWQIVFNGFVSSPVEKWGIHRLNQHTGTTIDYLNRTNILRLYKDSGGEIWAGSAGKGLFLYNSTTDRFDAFFDPESEMGKENIINIIEDDLKNLWIVTNSSIVKLGADRKRFFIYGKKYGIRSKTLRNGGICKTEAGEILVGSNNGYYALIPNEMNEYSKPLEMIITGFLINNQTVFSGKESLLKSPIEENKHITLQHNQNNFTFNFAAIDYRSPETIKYYTRMENFDSVWRDAGGDKSANYINVLPGKYIFHVKAINIDGVQTEKTIEIQINPPWWKTWWAYGMYGLMILIAGLFLHRVQKQRTIRIERQKAQVKELAQAKEIEKAYTELKTTQAQLIQSEKMASLGELTAGIAHEIQNPLNFVNNFSEVNRELISEMKEELEKGNLEEAKEIAADIADNEEKINQHGKRADSIVKGMLQHSRTQTGQREAADINALTDEYLRLSYHGLRARDKSFNATLQTDFDKNISKINIVVQDIGRVLLNLYNNAFYAVSEKARENIAGYEPTVSVSTKKLNDKIEIRVKDNGNGIPEKVVDKIFQPFFTTKPPGQGTGLGLSLSYDMIRSQGGEIRVETEALKFSIFIISLPV